MARLTALLWNSIYHKFRLWCSQGLFERLLKIINSDTDNTTLLELDSTLILRAKNVLADWAYSTIRDYLEKHSATVCIPDKVNFRIKHDFDAELYKRRNIVERFFQRIKSYRHIATRYDKLAVCFKNFVLLAAFVIHF